MEMQTFAKSVSVAHECRPRLMHRLSAFIFASYAVGAFASISKCTVLPSCSYPRAIDPCAKHSDAQVSRNRKKKDKVRIGPPNAKFKTQPSEESR